MVKFQTVSIIISNLYVFKTGFNYHTLKHLVNNVQHQPKLATTSQTQAQHATWICFAY